MTRKQRSGNPRKMVRQWAEKEYRNMRRIAAQGIRCPVPIELRGHVIAMSFLGHRGEASPRLKDADVSRETWRRLYVESISLMRMLYQDCRLVHGDFSEYNLILHEDHVYVIDVSQSVEHDHESSLDFLRRDCVNITKFFRKVIGVDGDSTLPLEGRDARDATDDGESRPAKTHAVQVLPVRELFDAIVRSDLLGRQKSRHTADKHVDVSEELPLVYDSDGSDDPDTRLVGIFGPWDVLPQEEVAKRLRKFDYLCEDMEEYIVEFWLSRPSAAVDDDVNESVFLNNWIPSNLHQISDLSLLETEMGRLADGNTQQLLCRNLLKDSLTKSDERSEESDDFTSSDEECVDGHEKKTRQSQTGESTSSEDLSCDSEEKENQADGKGKRKKPTRPSYVDGNFTGFVPEGMDRKEWKKLVKEEKREKRKTKTPKHIKKRLEKKKKPKQ